MRDIVWGAVLSFLFVAAAVGSTFLGRPVLAIVCALSSISFAILATQEKL